MKNRMRRVTAVWCVHSKPIAVAAHFVMSLRWDGVSIVLQGQQRGIVNAKRRVLRCGVFILKRGRGKGTPVLSHDMYVRVSTQVHTHTHTHAQHNTSPSPRPTVPRSEPIISSSKQVIQSFTAAHNTNITTHKITLSRTQLQVFITTTSTLAL